MDLYQSAIIWLVGSIASTYFVAMAYKNVKFVLKHKYVNVNDKYVYWNLDITFIWAFMKMFGVSKVFLFPFSLNY